MTKKELRELVRARKKQHTTDQIHTYSQCIKRTLLERIKREENCHIILLYHSLPDEVCTHDLIRTLYAQGYTVLLPSVVGDVLALHIYEGEETMNTGAAFGIQESSGTLFTEYSQIDLAIIPGMAFTQRGERLGRGKGYYDRLLPHLKCPLIGIAFPFQLLPSIPTEPHDIQMNEIITC
ncbi:MAG: 5-formyltetrahydrofolate cyclo-ligase [Bacteroidaceae bacterium]|nr:5-formyltetrahydrofolate cyclo-ligase [Bacteroidaceae bacterium]